MTAIPARSGAGMNAYCGSTRYRICVDTGGGIPLAKQVQPQTLKPFIGGCQSPLQTFPRQKCK